MTVVTADGVMQAALVEILLGYLQATVCGRALDGRVFAVQHDMVVDIDALVDPVAAGFCVGTLDHQLVEHCLDDLGHRANVMVRLHSMPTRRTRPPAAGLRGPRVIETLAAKVVLAGKLDGPIEGRMANEADEVAVGRGDVFEVGELGGYFDDSAVTTRR